jgi:hypothetical protein
VDFSGADFTNQKTISIGKEKSKYDPLQITHERLNNRLLEFFNSLQKYNLDTLNVPNGKAQQIEHNNRMKRESLLGDMVNFTYPIVDGSKYDVIINGYNVQDKCAVKVKKANSFVVDFKEYKLGDNDFYWVNMPDGTFYIIPEKELISEDDAKIKCRWTINSRFSQYHYNMNDPSRVAMVFQL